MPQTVVVPQTVAVPQTVVAQQTVVVQPTAAPVSANTLPRDETMYFNGQQWGPVEGWQPYSVNCNNALGIGENDNARVIMFETPYPFDMLDGKVYPLLADGPYAWDAGMTQITFKLKKAAKWSDGTPVTADDVAYTWATHLKYNDNDGNMFKGYIDTITAQDPQTVVVKSKLGADGKSINPLQVAHYLSRNYVDQKAWTQKLETRTGGDATKFLADAAEDVVYSGPYRKFFADDTKVIYVRDENYWGKDASMFGKLPVPKYLAHQMFKDNAAGSVAFPRAKWTSASSSTPTFKRCGSTTGCRYPPTCPMPHTALAPASPPPGTI